MSAYAQHLPQMGPFGARIYDVFLGPDLPPIRTGLLAATFPLAMSLYVWVRILGALVFYLLLLRRRRRLRNLRPRAHSGERVTAPFPALRLPGTWRPTFETTTVAPMLRFDEPHLNPRVVMPAEMAPQGGILTDHEASLVRWDDICTLSNWPGGDAVCVRLLGLPIPHREQSMARSASDGALPSDAVNESPSRAQETTSDTSSGASQTDRFSISSPSSSSITNTTSSLSLPSLLPSPDLRRPEVGETDDEAYPVTPHIGSNLVLAEGALGRSDGASTDVKADSTDPSSAPHPLTPAIIWPSYPFHPSNDINLIGDTFNRSPGAIARSASSAAGMRVSNSVPALKVIGLGLVLDTQSDRNMVDLPQLHPSPSIYSVELSTREHPADDMLRCSFAPPGRDNTLSSSPAGTTHSGRNTSSVTPPGARLNTNPVRSDEAAPQGSHSPTATLQAMPEEQELPSYSTAVSRGALGHGYRSATPPIGHGAGRLRSGSVLEELGRSRDRSTAELDQYSNNIWWSQPIIASPQLPHSMAISSPQVEQVPGVYHAETSGPSTVLSSTRTLESMFAASAQQETLQRSAGDGSPFLSACTAGVGPMIDPPETARSSCQESHELPSIELFEQILYSHTAAWESTRPGGDGPSFIPSGYDSAQEDWESVNASSAEAEYIPFFIDAHPVDALESSQRAIDDEHVMSSLSPPLAAAPAFVDGAGANGDICGRSEQRTEEEGIPQVLADWSPIMDFASRLLDYSFLTKHPDYDTIQDDLVMLAGEMWNIRLYDVLADGKVVRLAREEHFDQQRRPMDRTSFPLVTLPSRLSPQHPSRLSQAKSYMCPTCHQSMSQWDGTPDATAQRDPPTRRHSSDVPASQASPPPRRASSMPTTPALGEPGPSRLGQPRVSIPRPPTKSPEGSPTEKPPADSILNDPAYRQFQSSFYLSLSFELCETLMAYLKIISGIADASDPCLDYVLSKAKAAGISPPDLTRDPQAGLERLVKLAQQGFAAAKFTADLVQQGVEEFGMGREAVRLVWEHAKFRAIFNNGGLAALHGAGEDEVKEAELHRLCMDGARRVGGDAFAMDLGYGWGKGKNKARRGERPVKGFGHVRSWVKVDQEMSRKQGGLGGRRGDPDGHADRSGASHSAWRPDDID